MIGALVVRVSLALIRHHGQSSLPSRTVQRKGNALSRRTTAPGFARARQMMSQGITVNTTLNPSVESPQVTLALDMSFTQ